ncbi:MAG: hypothetical protein CM15mV111_010 [uncultured marine virus]|nr:MAG: hypothetical protein CM15mV111_010 [uncultured marine virus]
MNVDAGSEWSSLWMFAFLLLLTAPSKVVMTPDDFLEIVSVFVLP